MLSIEAAMISLYAEAGTNKAGLGVGVAAFYVFLIIYSLGGALRRPFPSTKTFQLCQLYHANDWICIVDVAGVVFYSELFPNHIRAKGVALCVMSIALTDLVYLQATAEAFANIGWRFYLVSFHRPFSVLLSSFLTSSCPFGFSFCFFLLSMTRLLPSYYFLLFTPY